MLLKWRAHFGVEEGVYCLRATISVTPLYVISLFPQKYIAEEYMQNLVPQALLTQELYYKNMLHLWSILLSVWFVFTQIVVQATDARFIAVAIYMSRSLCCICFDTVYVSCLAERGPVPVLSHNLSMSFRCKSNSHSHWWAASCREVFVFHFEVLLRASQSEHVLHLGYLSKFVFVREQARYCASRLFCAAHS